MTDVEWARKIKAMKIVLFVVGIALSAVAFVAAALELAALAFNPELSYVPGFGAVLRVISPDTLIFLLSRFPWKGWDFLLSFPGWLIFGVPGLALIVLARFKDDGTNHDEHEHSLFLFDELAKQAQEQDYQISGDDFAPGNHADMDIADGRYTQDNIVDDIVLEHDFLLDSTSSGANTHKAKE